MRQSVLVRVNPNEDGRRKAIGVMDFRDSELVKMLVRDGLRAGSAGTGRADKVASAPIVGEEDRTSERSPTAGEGFQPITNSGEKDAGRNRRQFTGGDVKQTRHPGWRLFCNPDLIGQAMPTADMRQTTHKPTRIAPRGVVSLMLVVDNT